MASYTDRTGTAVNGLSCSYRSLDNYNKVSGSGLQVPVPRTTTTGVYVVPAYGAPGYDTLTHGKAPGCSGYFNIGGAYMNDGGGCNQQYVTKMCQ